MNKKITTLEQLKGKTFKLGEYEPTNDREFTVNEVKYNRTNSILFTNRRTFNLLKSEIKHFLESIEIIEKKESFKATTEDRVLPSVKTEKVNLSVFEPTEAQIKTQEALSTMLDKVLAGEKEAIPQAKAICDIANTMVNMEKSQIQLMQLAMRKK